MAEKELVKVDRNGTKYWRTRIACDRCLGTGGTHLGGWGYYNNGRCFKCDGAKYVIGIVKEYTPEYEAKLEARRVKKEAEREAKNRAEALAAVNEIFPLGRMWFVLGETYGIKDQIKADGGRWLPGCKAWFFKKPKDGYKLLEVSVSDVFNLDVIAVPNWDVTSWLVKDSFKIEQ